MAILVHSKLPEKKETEEVTIKKTHKSKKNETPKSEDKPEEQSEEAKD